MFGITERMRVDDDAIRQPMGVVEKVRGRKKECVHGQKQQAYIFPTFYHGRAKIGIISNITSFRI